MSCLQTSSVEISDPKQLAFDNAVLQFIIRDISDMRSFATVEGEGFQRMISVINPQLRVKHHTHTQDNCKSYLMI